MTGSPSEGPKQPVSHETDLPQRSHRGQVVVAGVTGETRTRLTDVELQRTPLIREDNLSALRKTLLDRQEVRDLAALDSAIVAQRKDGDAEGVDVSVRRSIDGLKHVSQLYLADVERELAAEPVDMPKARVLMQLGYSYAKTLFSGRHKNPEAMEDLKIWQANIASRQPAVQQLVESYRQSIAAEVAGEKPDIIWLKQWIDLCTGFAPEMTAELTGQMQQAAQKRCEYFMAIVEAELRQSKPNMRTITSNLIVPPKYFADLPPASVIPQRMAALEQQVDALRK